MTDTVEFYENLRDEGATPEVAFLIMQKARIELKQSLQLLMDVFGLSSMEAKEVSVTADGKFQSLEDYQDQHVVPTIAKLIAIEEAEVRLGRPLTDEELRNFFD